MNKEKMKQKKPNPKTKQTKTKISKQEPEESSRVAILVRYSTVTEMKNIITTDLTRLDTFLFSHHNSSGCDPRVGRIGTHVTHFWFTVTPFWCVPM